MNSKYNIFHAFIGAEASADFELVQLGVLPVVIGIYGRSGKQFVEPLLHLRPDLRPGVSMVYLLDRVPQENKKSINELKAIYGLCGEADRACTGANAKFLKACKRQQNGINRLIFSGLIARLTA